MSTVKNRAPEAQSIESLITAAEELGPTIRKLVAGINAVLDSRPEPAPSRQEEGCHPNERTDSRLRAFLASMRPLNVTDDDHQRGRSLIERLALSAEGTDLPKLRLTSGEIADVLTFIGCSEPVEPQNWWEDDVDAPSHLVGYYLLLNALEESLREQSTEPQGSTELPEALRNHLHEQQTRLAELESLLNRLDDDDDVPMCMGMAVRMAAELHEAIDPVTLREVLKGAESQEPIEQERRAG